MFSCRSSRSTRYTLQQLQQGAPEGHSPCPSAPLARDRSIDKTPCWYPARRLVSRRYPTSPSAPCRRDDIDLDACAERQRSDGNRRAGGIRRLEVLGVDRVPGGEISHVRQSARRPEMNGPRLPTTRPDLQRPVP